MLWLAFCLLGSAWATPTVALHYGANAPLDDLQAFDIVVVEPGHGHNPLRFRQQKPHSQLYAYASVTEVQRSRAYYADMPAAWRLARNGDWDSEVIDQSAPAWPAFFADRVIGPLWAQGYRGFFLDTLDSYRLAAQFDEAAQQAGLVRVINTLHERFPGIQLIFNRGFDVLPQLTGKVQMVAAESLYRRWNASARRYEEVPAADRQWLMGKLRQVQQMGLPALVIDYTPPTDRALTRQIAQRIEADGFIPWVTDADVGTVGISSIELVPRHILMVHNGDESPALNYSNAHRFAQMPLNHMGYVVEYADIRQPLPSNITRDRYAGIVIWMSGYAPAAQGKALSIWLQARMTEGMPVAVLGDFGFETDRNWAKQWGVQADIPPPHGAMAPVQQNAMMGFESPARPVGLEFSPVRITPGTTGAQVLLELQDQKGQRFVGAALMPWGGFALDPFAVMEIPGTEQSRWVINPFDFLAQALQLPAIPIPDITTENGRRLLLTHIDGDGFGSRAEFAGSPLAAEVLLKEVLEKYRIPQTMSVVEGETASHGLFAQKSAALEDIAKRMFRLPHIEPASHTYGHPFLWDRTVKHGLFLENPDAARNLALPGYTFDLHREIVGSTNYINSKLVPQGKRSEILLWSGDTAPNAEALKIADEAGILNMNGGDTFISRATPSLTAVGAHGILKKGYLQVYAPITNENIYTNLWTGPFYGFERVLETFQMTNEPRRIKPVGIYYHTYSATKRAGLLALHKVYRWALDQALHPIYASEYIRKVQDFHSMSIARKGDAWQIRGTGHLRTLRLPPALGQALVAQSTGVAGYRAGAEGTYVHLSGPSTQLRTSMAPPRNIPFVYEANGRLHDWQFKTGADGNLTSFTLRAHVPLQWSLAQADGCQTQINGRNIPPTTSSAAQNGLPALRTFHLSDASAQVQIKCTAR